MSPVAGREVTVSVPATSANLGPGFDTLGLALRLRDEVTVRCSAAGSPADTRIRISGEGAAMVPRDDGHLVAGTIRRSFAEMGVTQPGLSVDARNAIPHGRGLGSSAAAIVAGIGAAMALVDPTRPLDHAAVLVAAAAVEGHPDNVAACVYGGLTLAWTEPTGARAQPLPILDREVVLVVPEAPFATHLARSLLPPVVGHDEAASNAGRSSLLVAVLTGAAPRTHLLHATEDLLHQPYRASAQPATTQVLTGLRAAGIAAVLSGAGPAVLAFCGADRVAEVETVVAGTAMAGRARVLTLPVDLDGLRLGGAESQAESVAAAG